MIERFASCAKSTISIDDEPCHKEACLQLRRQCQQIFASPTTSHLDLPNTSELTQQIQRQQRKITILQKSKELLAQQVALLKQELESKSLHLKNIESQQSSDTYRSREPEESGNQTNYSIVVQQKEQQIQYLCQQLKVKQRQLLNLRYENKQMLDELAGKESVLQKLRQSAQAQILFYKKQLMELEEELVRKDEQIQRNKQLHDDLMRKEVAKWEHAVANYTHKMSSMEKQIQNSKAKIEQTTKAFQSLERKKVETDQLLQTQKEKSKWLARLLQEAKIEFMHAQLKKLEKKQKTIKRRATPKNHLQLFNENRSYRSSSEVSTALTSAKTVGEQPTSTPVAPFRLHPHPHSLFRGNPADNYVFQAEWPNVIDLTAFNQF